MTWCRNLLRRRAPGRQIQKGFHSVPLRTCAAKGGGRQPRQGRQRSGVQLSRWQSITGCGRQHPSIGARLCPGKVSVVSVSVTSNGNVKPQYGATHPNLAAAAVAGPQAVRPLLIERACGHGLEADDASRQDNKTGRVLIIPSGQHK